MTTITLKSTTGRQSAGHPGGRVTPGRVLRAEWIKFRTLRSSWLTLGAAVAMMVVVGLVIGYVTSTSDWSTLAAEDTIASAPLQGFLLAQLLIGVLGVLFVTGEYGTGMISSTFAAVPKRLAVVGAKTVVFGVVALVTMTASSFLAFFGAQAILSADGHGSSLADPGVLRAVAGTGVYLALVGALGGALGWIIRSTAGAVGALVGILMVLPNILPLLGSSAADVAKYLPGSAGESFLSSVPSPDLLAPWTGLAVMGLWVVGALVTAAAVVRNRDA